MNGTAPILFGAAIAVVGALFVILVDWERIRYRWQRLGLIRTDALFQDGVAFGVALLSLVAWFVLSSFVGSWTIVVWLWSVA